VTVARGEEVENGLVHEGELDGGDRVGDGPRVEGDLRVAGDGVGVAVEIDRDGSGQQACRAGRRRVDRVHHSTSISWKPTPTCQTFLVASWMAAVMPPARTNVILTTGRFGAVRVNAVRRARRTRADSAAVSESYTRRRVPERGRSPTT